MGSQLLERAGIGAVTAGLAGAGGAAAASAGQGTTRTPADEARQRTAAPPSAPPR